MKKMSRVIGWSGERVAKAAIKPNTPADAPTTPATDFSGAIVDGIWGINLVKGGPNTLALSGGNQYTGTTTVSAGSLSINMARNVDPTLQAALQQGRATTDPALRAKAYQTVNKRMALDLPYLWLDRAVWSVESTLKVQNWNNPTTPSGSKAYGMIGGSIWPTQIWLS